MGSADKIVRLIIVAVLVALYFGNVLTGIWGTIALVAAGIFTLTSITGFCPLYAIFGIRTCPASKS